MWRKTAIFKTMVGLNFFFYVPFRVQSQAPLIAINIKNLTPRKLLPIINHYQINEKELKEKNLGREYSYICTSLGPLHIINCMQY